MYVIQYVPSGDFVATVSDITSDVTAAMTFTDTTSASVWLNDNGFKRKDDNGEDLYGIKRLDEIKILVELFHNGEDENLVNLLRLLKDNGSVGTWFSSSDDEVAATGFRLSASNLNRLKEIADEYCIELNVY